MAENDKSGVSAPTRQNRACRGPRAGLCLVGFMGAGKTSVGHILAKRLSWRFVDLDRVIESREGKNIPEIFRQHGEPGFRRVEAASLLDVLGELDAGPIALSLGGGAIVQPENALAVRRAGVPIVFLDAPVEVLRERCAGDGNQRPLFQDENHFRELYEARRKSYMEADVCIATAGLSVEEVVSSVIQRLSIEEL